jgi:hypothetical protein
LSAKDTSAPKDGKLERRQPPRPEAEPASLHSQLPELGRNSSLELPGPSTSRPLRQAHILRLQRQFGNAHVQRLLARQGGRAGRSIQRQDGDASAGAGPAPELTAEMGPTALIVSNSAADLTPGQMRKGEFLRRLEEAVCAVSDEALSDTFYSAIGCPYIERVFSRLPDRSADDIERMIHLFAPGTQGAETAEAYIKPITGRVRVGIANWLATGQVTGVPADLAGPGGEVGGQAAPEATPSLEGGEMVSRQMDDGLQSEVGPQRVQRELGPGQPLDGSTRSRMEHGLGRSLGEVVIHTNAQAASMAGRQNARAFTVGKHVAFGSGEYRPGTLVGDALLAHELAHTIQQSESASQLQRAAATTGALESDADQSAAGMMARLWSGTQGRWAGLQYDIVPSLRSGLRLQHCGKKKSHDEMVEKSSRIDALLSNPDENADTILEIIDSLEGDAAEVLMMVKRLQPEPILRTVGGTERGPEIIERAIQVLKAGGMTTLPSGDALEQYWQEQTAEVESLSEDTQKAIERINTALDEDPRRNQYADVVKLPVAFLPKVPMTGGVYYDPSMPKPTDKKTSVGQTEVVSLTDPEGRSHYPLIFIKLGPRVLMHSDAYIRSAFWHEFEHYQRYTEFRSSDAGQTEESRGLEKELQSGHQPNHEIEATSRQAAADFDMLSEPELRSVIRYLAEHMAEPAALPEFKEAAVNRIMDALAADETKLQRLLDVIKGVPQEEQKALAGLTAAIEKKLPTKKQSKKKSKKKK